MKSLRKLQVQLLLVAIFICVSPATAQDESSTNANYTPSENPTLVLTPSNFFVSQPVRDLPVCDDMSQFDGFIVPKDGANTSQDLSPKRKRKLAHLNSAGRSSTSIDPNMQLSIAPNNTNLNRAPIVSFDDVGNSSSPPDPSMAVGPNHIVTMQNGVWAVYDKTGVMAPGFPKTLDDPLSGPNHGDNAGDPVVMYDRVADRWFISQFQLSGNPALSDNVFLIGISTTPDPTGAFNIYEYELGAGNDYPHYGVWGDSYVTAGNFTGPQKVYTFNRNKMLAGDPTAEIAGFSPSNLGVGGFAAPIPVHSEGAGDATGDIKIVFYQDDAFGGINTDHIGLWNIDMDWTNAATINASTISNKVEIPTAPFDAAIAGGFANIAQPGTNQRIDAIVGAVMNMSHWYKFPTHESILLNWVVEIQDGTQKSGIRWVELRSLDNGNTWNVFQEGTFTDPAATTVAQKESVFMGCISMDADGNIGLGYTKSGTNTFPSLYYTGRMNGDPLGQMTIPEELAVAGTTSVTFNDRYGDYGQGVRDPEDDLTFWVTSEYSGDPGFQRKSRVYSFKLASDIPLEITCPNDVTIECGEDTTPANTGSATAESVCDPAPVITFTDQVEQTCGNTQIITRTWVAADNCASPVATCDQIITVVDTTAPTVDCPENISVFNDPDQCTAVVNYDAVTGSDSCGNVTVTQTSGLPSGSEFPIGDTDNEFEIEDECGNITTCSFTVTVNNSVVPEAICQNITVQLDANGLATITTADINGGTGTVCESDNATIDIDTFDCSNIGDNEVVLTITDNAGNVDTCTAIVTVEDIMMPEIDCAPFTIELDETGTATITEDMIAALSTDNCEIETIDISTTSYDCTMVGEQTVTVVITDGSGNSNSCDITVTVADSTPPTPVCQDITVELDADGLASIEVTDINNGSFDNCGNVTVDIDTTTFNCDNIGTNEVVMTVMDDNGNTAECVAIVTVLDNLAPDAQCENITITLDEDNFAEIDVTQIAGTSTDNCEIVSMEIDVTTFGCNEIGDNDVNLTLIDGSGNTTQCTATVTVTEGIFPPNAVCQNITVTLMEDGTATVEPSDFDNGSSGIRCFDGLSISQDTFSCEDIGQTNQVLFTVTNAAGETDSCTAFVNVVDGLAPQVVCPADQTVNSINGPFELPDYFALGDAIATDNCTDPITVYEQDPLPGTLLDAGDHEITITVQDANGFEAECSFILTVDVILGNGINDASLNTISLYPNPANNQITLSNPKNAGVKSVTIYDVAGRQVVKEVGGIISSKTINISSLNSGMYLVLIEGEFGQISKQLIKE